MECKVKNKLKVNKHVIISKLKDGTKYILLRIKDELVPLFLKRDIVEIISLLKEEKYTEEEVYEKYGEDSANIIKILKNYNIIYDGSNNDDDLSIDFDYEDQWEELSNRSFETRTPLLAKIEVTYNCNYKCKYCYVDGVKGNMLSFEDLKIIMEKLKRNGVNDLFITGGEPFLHPNIMEIIDFSENIGFVTTIQTNASLINEEKVEKLKEYKNIVFGISFHSYDEEKFDKFTQTKGSYKRTLKAVELLKEAKIPFYLKLPVTGENQEDLKSNVKFFEENGYDFKIYTQIFPSVNDGNDNSKYEVDSKYIKWLYENKYLKFIPTTCSAFINKLWISSKGDVYPCELVRKNMGNLVKEDFDTIWFSKKAEEVLNSSIYNEIEKCKKCDKKKYCNKCLAYLNYNSWGAGLKHFCNTAGIIKSIEEDNSES